MSNDELHTKVRLGTPDMPVRLSFPTLFKPSAMGDGGTPKYSATFLIPVEYDMTPLKLAVVAAAVKKWGEAGKQLLKDRKIRLPWRDQSEKSHLAGYEEGYFLPTSSKNRPGVVDNALQPITDPADAVSGMLVIATLNAYGYDKNGKGVSFGLQNLMIYKDDGTRYGGNSSRPEEDFADIKATGNGAEVESSEDIF